MIIREIDTLYFGLEIFDYYNSFKNQLRTIKELKEKGIKIGIPEQIEINNIQFTIELSGVRFYSLRLTCKDFTILFAEKPSKENPPIRILFASSYLWSFGFKSAYEKFLNWFEYFNLKIEKSKVSRLDICCDTDKVKFCPSDIDCIISYSKSKTIHYVGEINDVFYQGKTFSGFTISRGNPLLCRIYDKTLEVKTSSKIWFHDIWADNDWKEQNKVWRVEFQLRREILKDFGLDSVEDCFEALDGLWKYLTGHWLQLKIPTNDKVTRWKNKRKWITIQKALQNDGISPLIREKIKQGNLEKLVNQGCGIILSIAALSNHDDIYETAGDLATIQLKKIKAAGKTFKTATNERRRQYM